MTHRPRGILGAAALALALQLPLFGDGWFGPDKLKHFFIAAFVQSFTYSVAQAAGADRGDAMRAAVGVTGAAAIGKEIHDARAGRPFSVPDLVWGAGGMGAATAMLRHTK